MSILAKINESKLHLENETSYSKTCKLCKYSERSLKRWIERYYNLGKDR